MYDEEARAALKTVAHGLLLLSGKENSYERK
jgi:hypothetical protein